ncbi:protein takeout-like [Calliphora vicina]|uniref:protein takeout-like n=1 Tax=Calliphora vicina TaxID=7373 RepID=UPI00325B246A
MFSKLNVLIVLSLNVWLVLAAPQVHNFKEISEIPSDIPVCSEKDLNINECIRNAYQQMIPRAKNGIPELNIPPMDPLEVDKTNYEFANSIIQGKVALRNLKINGLSDTIINSVDFKKDGDNIKMEVKSLTPKLFIEGKYKAEVKINDARMNSKGVFNLTMTDIDVIAQPEAELYERDGHKYMRITKFNIEPTLGNMKFYATGLVPDAILNDAILEFVNQNWRTVYKSLIPETRSTWEPEFLKVSNEYFSHLPFDLILTKE